MNEETKQRFEYWARMRPYSHAMVALFSCVKYIFPRKPFDLRGYRLKLDDARLDLDEPCPCMEIRDGVLRVAAPFLPPPTGADALVYTQSPAAVVAMNLKNSHAALEAETLRKDRDALAFEYAECQQELLEERESHVQTWQIAQRQIVELKDKLEASQVKWACADDDALTWRIRWLDTQTRFEKACAWAFVFFLGLLYLVVREALS